MDAVDERQVGYLTRVFDVPFEYGPRAEPVDWPVEHADGLCEPSCLQKGEECFTVLDQCACLFPALDYGEDETTLG